MGLYEHQTANESQQQSEENFHTFVTHAIAITASCNLNRKCPACVTKSNPS